MFFKTFVWVFMMRVHQLFYFVLIVVTTIYVWFDDDQYIFCNVRIKAWKIDHYSKRYVCAIARKLIYVKYKGYMGNIFIVHKLKWGTLYTSRTAYNYWVSKIYFIVFLTINCMHGCNTKLCFIYPVSPQKHFICIVYKIPETIWHIFDRPTFFQEKS